MIHHLPHGRGRLPKLDSRPTRMAAWTGPCPRLKTGAKVSGGSDGGLTLLISLAGIDLPALLRVQLLPLRLNRALDNPIVHLV